MILDLELIVFIYFRWFEIDSLLVIILKIIFNDF